MAHPFSGGGEGRGELARGRRGARGLRGGHVLAAEAGPLARARRRPLLHVVGVAEAVFISKTRVPPQRDPSQLFPKGYVWYARCPFHF